MVVFVQSGYIWAKVVVFGQKWLYYGKRGCIRERWLCSGKVVVFGQKWLKSCKSVCIRTQCVCIYAKVSVFGQSGCIWAEWLYFGKTWLYFGKSVCIRSKVLVFG